MNEMTKQGASAHPADLIAAINGADKITLGGFGVPPMPHSWLRPGLRFVSAHESPVAAVATAHTQHRVQILIRWATAVLLLAFGLGAGFWGGTFTVEGPSQSWSVVQVEASGVVIRQSSGTEAFVKSGSKLPNGDLLKETNPAQRAYVTDKAAIMINPS